MKKLLLLLALSITSYTYGQTKKTGEIGKCGDGVDNDGDGFVDCYDDECYTDGKCADFFIGKDATCDAKPDSFPPFTMALKYYSNKGTHHPNRLIVGDVDGDKIPEIVTTYRAHDPANTKEQDSGLNPWGGYINIFQPNTAGVSPSPLILDKQIVTGTFDGVSTRTGLFPTYEDILMADIDRNLAGGDSSVEIFVLCREVTLKADGSTSTTNKIMAYDSKTGNPEWLDASGNLAPINAGGVPATIGIADFDGDGKSELYYKGSIFDAHTGKLMGSVPGGNGYNNGPIAADILSATPGLEFISGLSIYSVKISRSPTPTATLTRQKFDSNYFARGTSSQTSVADFNQDGKLDVLAVGCYGNANDNTTIFFWDVANNNLKTFKDPVNWGNGAGRLNVADIDGDTLMNIVYVSGSNLVALEESPTGLVELWRDNGVVENTSGYTGCTLFDFNADGKSEIVYRDEENIYIYTSIPKAEAAATGIKYSKTSQPCKSRTAFEYPIVADVDNDGHAEICVTCAVAGTFGSPGAAGKALKIYDDAQIRVFESGDPINAPWVPARKVWNQHGYFIVNVNDNLTIPTSQQMSELIFSGSAPCRGGGKNRPFNSFLNQAPYTNSLGCPQYAAPNLTYLAGSLVINAPTCPDKNFTVSLTIKNLGNKNIAGNIPISFYNKNPFKPGATKYNTVKIALPNLIPGSTFTTSALTVTGNGSADSLYIVLNDAGTAAPGAVVKLPNTAFIECDYDNGIPAYVIPKPVPMTAKTVPDFQCPPGTNKPTGSAAANVTINGVDRTSEFTYYWSDGTTAKPIPADFTGVTYAQRAAGTYTVFGVNKVANCGTTTIQAVVKQSSPTLPLKVEIKLVQNDDNCLVPNGILRAIVNDYDGDGVGEPAANFDFGWYKADEVLSGTKISSADTAKVLVPNPYQVVVTDKKTGCSGNGTVTNVEDKRPRIKVALTPTKINCSPLPTGTVTPSFTAFLKNSDGSTTPIPVPSVLTYNWYNGKNVKPGLPDYPTSTQSLSGVAANDYTLFVLDQATQCKSDTVTATVTKTLPPSGVSVAATQPQSSCNGTKNGAASVSVAVGDNVSNYTYKWFKGQNTTNTIVGETGSVISNLDKGIYTVEVTSNTTKCSVTLEVTILDDTTPLAVTPTPIANAGCFPSTGSVTIGLPASATLTDFTFFLDNGKTTSQQNGNNLFAALNSGTYNVWAVNNITTCKTTVKQTSVANHVPVFAPVNGLPILPSDCHGPTGTLSISASGSNFQFDWYKGGAPTGTPLLTQTGTASTLAGIATGNYTVKVTDLSTNCFQARQQFLSYKFAPDLTATSTDLFKCVPLQDGSIDALLTPIAGDLQTDFDLFIYTGSIDDPLLTPYKTIPTSGGSIGKHYITTSFDEDYYTITAVSKKPDLTLGCRVSTSVELKRITTNPVINTVVTNNTLCAPKTGGKIHLDLGPTQSDNPADYSFSWTPAVSVNQDAINLTPGAYSVKVTYSNPAKPNEGCASSTPITIQDEPQILALTVNPTSVTHCDPLNGLAANPEGAAQIDKIIIDGNTGSPVVAPYPGNFSFAWKDNSGTTIGGSTSTLSTLMPGTYHVNATNSLTGCVTDVVDVVIEDKTIGTVGVDLTDFRNEVICVTPRKGMLRVAGSTSGTNILGYSYDWYNGLTTASPHLANTLDSLAMLSESQNITVRVTNRDNNCWAIGTYKVDVFITPFIISANSTPITDCVNPLMGTDQNGTLYSAVISPLPTVKPPEDYTYIWEVNGVEKFRLQPPQTTTDKLTISPLKQADIATYTVTAIDGSSEPRCKSNTVKVFFDDEHISPVVNAFALLPVTHCNLDPNGSAMASIPNVDGDSIKNYTIEWFDFAPTPDPSSFHTGPDVDGLTAYFPNNTYYNVVATNIFTGCSASDTVAIKYVPISLKRPVITVLADQISCDLDNPTGALTADIDGNTSAYQFTWTKTDDTSFGPKPGPTITDLAACEKCYKVLALDTATGCTSDTLGSILFKPVYPEFDMEVVSPTCNNDNGYAAIFIMNTDPIEIKSIEWFLEDNLVYTGNTDPNAVAGDHYKVVVTTTMECKAEKTFGLRPEIHPYNGISRNNDTKNDHFHIDCIDSYPGNIVKIYNRIGTLVYEAVDYDNLDIMFDGRSNKGVSPMGTNLPDGTYFYIIDKRNGSKQLAGYLEIVN